MDSLRIELKPSRRLQGALWMLAALAAFAVWKSALPALAMLAVPPLLAAALWRLRDQPAGMLELQRSGAAWLSPPPAGPIVPEPTACQPLRLDQRGPLHVLVLRVQGRVRRWAAASDTLAPAQCRALRLWLQRYGSPPSS